MGLTVSRPSVREPTVGQSQSILGSVNSLVRKGAICRTLPESKSPKPAAIRLRVNPQRRHPHYSWHLGADRHDRNPPFDRPAWQIALCRCRVISYKLADSGHHRQRVLSDWTDAWERSSMKLSCRTGWTRWMALVGLAFSTGTMSVAEEYQLRYKFVPQQTLTYVSQNDAILSIQYNQDRENPSHMEMMIRSMRVTSVGPDGVANLDLSIDRAYMTATSDGKTSVYDSAHPEKAGEEFAEAQEALRKSTPARVNSLGKVLPVEGATDPVVVDLLCQLPEQPVSVGSTWKEKFESGVQIDAKSQSLMRPLKMERRFVLKSVEGQIATITMTTACLSPLRDPFQESQVMQRKPGGTVKFDIERGCLIERDLRIDDKAVGFQGVGTAMATRSVTIDRLITPEQARQVNLLKPLLPVQTALGIEPATR